ncbi:hypothetical protein SAMN04244573_02620 [Azotobacter beijerinckii]|uniref:Methyltransferase domain-containing protein n=1 Tax=Azotobacter beijerinckii TaxID=170623 RepID=A0A1H9KBQ8_9GAMM|nr:hypothetical protein [Azotobacter beijerinckii]SEQ96584.1 hypothetical protein SAMN04244573_02620 [Azotobacter beijerinckii]
MDRIHLFEWEDQEWFPELFRDFITDHLAFYMGRAYRAVVPQLAEAMKSTEQTSIVDLCSGGGGPIPALLPAIAQEAGRPVSATLTDLYPNASAVERINVQVDGAVRYRAESTNAMNCPESLRGFRTIFTGFHHFRPESAKRILADAVRRKAPIAVFEAQERSLWRILTVPILLLLGSLIFTPFVGRLTFKRFFFTYVIPLAPFFIAFDGVVSCFRTYTPKELEQLTEGLDRDSYRWETGRYWTSDLLIGPYRITYLIGTPVAESGAA